MSDANAKANPQRRPLLHLYIDETGSRHLDKPTVVGKHGFDWFALGGLLINEEDEASAETKLSTFLVRWPQIRSPLHFTDMRAKKKGFAWLGNLDGANHTRFWSEFRTFLVSVPGAGTGCVINRPGYAARGYGQRHGDAKWLLCRSAFDILVDRTAKHAKAQGRRLRVFYERADPITDARVQQYFKTLKSDGLAFDETTSAKYTPLTKEEFAAVLLSIEGKDKKNRILQIADSYIYAIARGSYDVKFEVYKRISESGKLITSQVPGGDASILGIKKYCFD
jgi:Protein of unknown function (DUF3800)